MPINSGSSATAHTGPAAPGGRGEAHGRGEVNGQTAWAQRTRVVLTPVAAPSILGLFGFATATGMVASVLAGWWGNGKDLLVIFPFAMLAGGVAQFVAGLWAYRARDGLATAMHGIWGSFWLAFGLLYGLIAAKILPATPLGAANPAFGIWFVLLTVITGLGAVAAVARNVGLVATLSSLAVGSGFYAASLFAGSHSAQVVAGYLFSVSALMAIYVAGALMLSESFGGRVVLPLGEYKKGSSVPGRQIAYPVEYEAGMPGAKVGQ